MTYDYSFFGFVMQQKKGILDQFSEFLIQERPQRIIEIGMGYGGLSIGLALYSYLNNIDYTTYDIELRHGIAERSKEVIELLGKKLIIADIFELEDEMARLYQIDGKVLTLCDGGNKIKELDIFSKYIKSNDIIMAHDYHAIYFPPPVEFVNNQPVFAKWPNVDYIPDYSWPFCEVYDSAIQHIIDREKLEKVYAKLFEEYNWVCLMKK